MNHPHPDQRHPVKKCSDALVPHTHLVHAPVSPLDHYTSAIISSKPGHGKTGGPLVVIDGEIITSTITTIPAPGTGPHRSLFRRLIEDPYWILMTLTTTVVLAIAATIIYGAAQIAITLTEWLHANSATIIGITILIILLALCGGAGVAKCAGIHCGGCKDS